MILYNITLSNRFLLFVITVIYSSSILAQNPIYKPVERKGFVFGTAIGASAINLTFADQSVQNEISSSLPNFKIGTMVSKKVAVLLYLPGSLYTYVMEGRKRSRGFEAIMPSIQYWLNDRLWVLVGAGLGMDAPAFYDIENEAERKFYFGFAGLAGAGYELWHKGKFALDLQGRIHYGTADRPEGKSTGLAFNLLIGFNWY